MIIDHECSGCFRKLVTDTTPTKQPNGEYLATVRAYCDKCCEDDPLNALMVKKIMTIHGGNFHGVSLAIA